MVDGAKGDSTVGSTIFIPQDKNKVEMIKPIRNALAFFFRTQRVPNSHTPNQQAERVKELFLEE